MMTPIPHECLACIASFARPEDLCAVAVLCKSAARLAGRESRRRYLNAEIMDIIEQYEDIESGLKTKDSVLGSVSSAAGTITTPGRFLFIGSYPHLARCLPNDWSLKTLLELCRFANNSRRGKAATSTAFLERQRRLKQGGYEDPRTVARVISLIVTRNSERDFASVPRLMLKPCIALEISDIAGNSARKPLKMQKGLCDRNADPHTMKVQPAAKKRKKKKQMHIAAFFAPSASAR